MRGVIPEGTGRHFQYDESGGVGRLFIPGTSCQQSNLANNDLEKERFQTTTILESQGEAILKAPKEKARCVARQIDFNNIRLI